MSTRISFFALLVFQFCLLKSCGHFEGNDGHRGSNRLQNADSPYLREHADNPVDWYEWGPEALDKARRENKPLIISIGYASCHWCHVMEQESFMDTAVARIMNDYFVAIKVDREQRPDIDQIYVNAAQLISGGAGWPLNAFALPDGRPFYAGTYFPREQWLSLLKHVRRAYKNEKSSLVKQADAVTNGVRSSELITTAADSVSRIDKGSYQEIFHTWVPVLDFKNGGLKGAPKFPMPANLEFLLQYHVIAGNEKAREIVMLTLDRMAAGGINDAVGGGFYRYSTDSLWHIPHFEKMLYDNAQLASLYAHAFRLTKDPLYAQVLRETLAFVEHELKSPEGAFYSSINADSEGEEGKYYCWTLDEIKSVLDPQTAELIASYYGATAEGNWEDGKNVLFAARPTGAFARQNKMSGEAWDEILIRARHALKEARSKRIRPTTDDKVLTSWNALMLTAFADAYMATGEKAYLETALKNAAFLETKMMKSDGALWRNYKDGTATIEGFMDDYALVGQAFIDLYQVTFDMHWLEKARTVSQYALRHFLDPYSRMCFYTADGAENLIARKMEVSDNVIPSSNSVFAEVLFELGQFFQEPSFALQGRMMLNQVSKDLAGNQALYFGNWARLSGMCAYRPYEVAIMGDNATHMCHELQKQKYQPLALYCGGRQENLPLLENKYVDGKTIVYVCRDRVCKLPVTEVSDAILLLQ